MHSTPPIWREVLAAFGLFMYLLGCILLFVTSVEFDPTGKTYRTLGQAVEGDVMLQKDGRVLLSSTEGVVYEIERFDTYKQFRTSLSPLYGYAYEGKVIPSTEIPHAPRSPVDFIVPTLWVVLSLLCIAASPGVLYVDYFRNT